MANIAYTVNENSPETILGVEQYLSQDTDLITSFQVNNTFIPTKHLSELHILTLSDDLIESDYSYNNYKLLQNAQSAGTEGASVITVDPVQDVKLYGYDIGGVKLLYHFLNNPYGEGRTPIEFYIDSISPDRTEVRLNTLNLTSEAVLAITTNIVKNSQNRSYQDEFRLNFKNNDLLIVVNINSVQVGSDTMVAIKLYEPLPLQYGVKSVLSIVEIISDSIAYQVSTKITEAVSTAPLLSTPNFDIEVEEESVTPTGYFNYDELFSYPINNSNSQIFSTVNEKGIDISIDYSDFNNFIQFSSAQERLLNFKYKADLLNSYTISKATLSNSKKGSSGVSGSRTYYEGLIEGIVNNFDHYERHLYYESGSTSWPKSNNTRPYTINLNSTGWYQDKLEEAAAFDETSNTSLISTIPAYLREDENNQNYLTFVYMIGQHFDNLWVYTQAVTDKYNADNRLHSGISKDLVAEALKNFGVKLYTSNKSIEDLFTTFIGQEYQPGNEQINNYVVASVPTPKLNTTLIGTQTWTDRNLDVTTYRDGTPIPYEPDQAKWVSATSGAWCYPNNSSANDPIYGKLYNWYAVAGIDGSGIPRILAPLGYHVPTDAEWTTLTTYLGGLSVAGGKMKSTGTSLWQSPNTDATNESGFTGLPGGYRDNSGPFNGIGCDGFWWSSSEYDASDAWSRYLDCSDGSASRSYDGKTYGFSIRLLLESPTIPIPPTSLDSYQKEIYKRIYHNLPLLLKSKGTERGLRALINCFGISSDILNIKIYGGRNVETQPFFGDYRYSTSSIDKVRIDSTGGIENIDCLQDGGTLSLYTSNYKKEDKYTDDLHAVEVGFSPSDNIDQFIISSSLASTQLANLNIDNYIGDPRDLTSSTYTGLSTVADSVLGNLKQYDVTDYIRLIKFFDNTVFRMVRDFIPARASVDTGIVIKPHILNRNKAKSVKASVSTINSASMNNAFNYTSSIDTALSSGSDGGVFGSRDQFITSPGYIKHITPLGNNIKQTLVEDGKYTGELPNSNILISTGELNNKNSFKNKIPTTLTFNIGFYDTTTLPTTTCTLTTYDPTIIVKPLIEYNLSEYFTNKNSTPPKGTIYYKTGTTPIVQTNPVYSLDEIAIGTQTWTSKNLDVTTYSDTTPIPYEPDQAKWVSATSGAWCYPNNSSANDPVYGKLYNWYAVAGIWNEASKTDVSQRKKLAPSGYHVPTDLEWTTLINHLDPTANGGITIPNTAGGKMKATGTSLWSPVNTGANNSSGFTGLPGGSRGRDGAFISINTNGRWWSSSEIDSIDSYGRTLNNNNTTVNRPKNDKRNGFSIRLVKDTTTPTVTPATDTSKYIFPLAQYETIRITANAGNISEAACTANRNFKVVSCDIRTKQNLLVDYITQGQTYDLSTFFNLGVNSQVEYAIARNEEVLKEGITPTDAKAYIFPPEATDGDNFIVKVKDQHDSSCTTSISLINKVCPLGPEPGPSIFYTTVLVPTLNSEVSIIPNNYFTDNLTSGTYYYRQSDTTTSPTGAWILSTLLPSQALSFTSAGKILQLRCVNIEGCEKIIEIRKEVGVGTSKILTNIYWSDNIKQACNLGDVQGTGQLPGISSFFYIDNSKTPIKTLSAVLLEYKTLYRITDTTSILFTGVVLYDFTIYIIINGRLSRTVSSCDIYNNPVQIP
jgi:uncharacterized protein (TIGR02145 family)